MLFLPNLSQSLFVDFRKLLPRKARATIIVVFCIQNSDKCSGVAYFIDFFLLNYSTFPFVSENEEVLKEVWVCDTEGVVCTAESDIWCFAKGWDWKNTHVIRGYLIRGQCIFHVELYVKYKTRLLLPLTNSFVVKLSRFSVIRPSWQCWP